VRTSGNRPVDGIYTHHEIRVRLVFFFINNFERKNDGCRGYRLELLRHRFQSFAITLNSIKTILAIVSELPVRGRFRTVYSDFRVTGPNTDGGRVMLFDKSVRVQST